MPPATLLRYTFGPFALDPRERRLLRAGRAVALPPKTFDVLAVLVARAGGLVTKDELLAAAWPGVFVEESAVTVAVSRLRASLGPEGRGYIETVAGHGFRFVAPVAVGDVDPSGYGARDPGGPAVEDLVPSLTISGDGVAAPSRRGAFAARGGTRRWQVGLLAMLGVFALASAALAVRRQNPSPVTGPAAGEAVPSPEALLAYRRARALWASRRGEVFPEALAQYNLAIAAAPAFAPAHVGAAQILATGYQTGPAAEAAVGRALALDSTHAEAWATLAFIRAFQEWDWAGAEAAFDRARAIDDDDVTTLQWLASMRMAQGRLPESEAALRRAISLAPDQASLHADLCQALYFQRAWADAAGACARALALDPAHPMAGEHALWIRLAGPDSRAEAENLLADIPTSNPHARARLHARLGQRGAALADIERVVAARAFTAPFLYADPLFDSLRDDPRWTAAMRRMRLG